MAFQVAEGIFPDSDLDMTELAEGRSAGRDTSIVAFLKPDRVRKNRTQSPQETSVRKLGVPRQFSSLNAVLFAISNTGG
jgi:hypothetical protein